jgi:hypothetical protein
MALVFVNFLSYLKKLEREGFILDHGLRGFSPWSADSIAVGL